jgi:galactokinase/mevalonate kinase-like predicted kinase
MSRIAAAADVPPGSVIGSGSAFKVLTHVLPLRRRVVEERSGDLYFAR